MSAYYRNQKYFILLSFLTICSLFLLNGTMTNSDYKSEKDNSNWISNEKNGFNLPQSSEFLTENWSVIETIDGNSTDTASQPIIKYDQENNIHVIWITSTSGIKSLFYRIYYYQTQNWSTPLNITAHSGSLGYQDTNPDLAILGTDGYITWVRSSQTVMFCKVNINLSIVRHELVHNNLEYFYPQIQVNKVGDIVIVYKAKDGAQYKIQGHYQSVNNPSSWLLSVFDVVKTSSDFTLTSGLVTTKLYWDAANQLHIAFIADKVAEDRSVYYTKNSSALTVQTAFTVYDKLELASFPIAIALDGNSKTENIFLSWTNGSNIYVYNKTFTSENFTNPFCLNIQKISYPTNYIIEPEIVFDQNNQTLVAWYDSESDSIKYVLNISNYVIIDSTSLIGTSKRAPSKAISNSNDLALLYYDALDSNKIKLRILDRHTPNANILSPSPYAVIFGNITIMLETEPDTREVKYDYYNGTHWISIVTLNDLQNYSYIWNLPNEDKLNITIRVIATDKNGLNNSHEVNYITVDNNAPEIIAFSTINDEFGHNAVNSPHFLKGKLNITFTASDNTTGIIKVELRNGTMMLAESETINPQYILWDTTGGAWDGNYSGLFLRAYDFGGKTNNSNLFPYSIIIDNFAPSLDFTNLTANMEYTGILNVTVNLSPDTSSVEGYILSKISSAKLPLNYDQGFNLTKQPGTNNWSVIWNTKAYNNIESGIESLNGNFTIYFFVKDIYGNNATYSIQIQLDNTAPIPIYITPLTLENVGFEVLVSAYTDLDTERAVIRYGEYSDSILNPFLLPFSVEVTNFTSNNTYKLFSQMINLIQLKKEGDVSIYIAIIVYDNQGLYTSSTNVFRRITLKSAIPASPSYYDGPEAFPIVYNQDGKTYNIPIVINSLSGSPKYLIYRSLESFDTAALNKLDPVQRLDYLGSEPGEKYCVGNISGETEDSSMQPITFIDRGVPANRYYYIIIGVNEYNTASNCSAEIIKVTPYKAPAKIINLDDLMAMPFVFGFMVIVMGLISIGVVKSRKQGRTRSEIKKVYDNILDEEYNVDKKNKVHKSLTNRLDDIESLLNENYQEQTKPKTKTDEMDLDALLGTTIEEKKEQSIIGDGGLKKCPFCGWTISKGATKCPKCQKKFY